MGVIKLDRNWTDSKAFDDVSCAARWHYLSLIMFCSRNARVSGVVSKAEACTCSDVPDPVAAVHELATADLVNLHREGLAVVDVGRFLTSKRTLKEREAAKDRERAKSRAKKARQRARLNEVVFSRDGYRCVGCGTGEDLTIDHIYPQALGGGDEIENLRTLCRRCNASKGISLNWQSPLERQAASS